MPAVYIKTYGCQMNERDSEQVVRQLEARGYTLCHSEEEADVILLNTCSVREMAEQKAIGRMKSLSGLKKRKPSLVLGVLGCMAQRLGPELLDKLPDVDLIVGTQKFHEVADYVDRLRAEPKHDPLVDVAEQAGSQNTIREHTLEAKQVTAFVSIMQGCNMHCTFCIVPSTRGAERSRPIADIVAEVRQIAAQGIREVTLLGQIVNLYGRHEFPAVDGRSPFVQLLHAVCAVPGIERVRFTSPHPIGFKKDLVQAFRELPQLCEHVHLPMQSGSNRILKAMHRAYTVEQYLKLVDDLREARPDIGLTSDIIVGFPGETEADYLATRDAVAKADFDNAFIFRYSPRSDTPAATMVDQLSEDARMARNQDLLALLDDIALRKNQSIVGSDVEILVEGESKNNPLRYAGRTRSNRLVLIEANPRWLGQLLNVKITSTTGFTYYAEPVLTPDTLEMTTV
ncbi:MAG: tRNA (N6-isopentenyl adenosine(37)-C2)-methylthiotransferase MiaB [Verrucomicrobia bacterium Tous-C9LFEB]|nr:MAG: tRNA (N6-isopentenyl adenosine(37)-C2)-methylthiotransferase MiaB [Verrucomicrobia bacterium Tous-C9LFEB]